MARVLLIFKSTVDTKHRLRELSNLCCQTASRDHLVARAIPFRFDAVGFCFVSSKLCLDLRLISVVVSERSIDSGGREMFVLSQNLIRVVAHLVQDGDAMNANARA